MQAATIRSFGLFVFFAWCLNQAHAWGSNNFPPEFGTYSGIQSIKSLEDVVQRVKSAGGVAELRADKDLAVFSFQYGPDVNTMSQVVERLCKNLLLTDPPVRNRISPWNGSKTTWATMNAGGYYLQYNGGPYVFVDTPFNNAFESVRDLVGNRSLYPISREASNSPLANRERVQFCYAYSTNLLAKFPKEALFDPLFDLAPVPCSS